MRGWIRSEIFEAEFRSFERDTRPSKTRFLDNEVEGKGKEASFSLRSRIKTHGVTLIPACSTSKLPSVRKIFAAFTLEKHILFIVSYICPPIFLHAADPTSYVIMHVRRNRVRKISILVALESR